MQMCLSFIIAAWAPRVWFGELRGEFREEEEEEGGKAGKEERKKERKKEHWLSIPGEPSLEKSSASSAKVINRSCTSPPHSLSLRVLAAWEVLMLPRDINHTLRQGRGGGGRQGGSRGRGEQERGVRREGMWQVGGRDKGRMIAVWRRKSSPNIASSLLRSSLKAKRSWEFNCLGA